MRIVGSTGYLEVTTIPTSVLAGVVSYYTRCAARFHRAGSVETRQFGAWESRVFLETVGATKVYELTRRTDGHDLQEDTHTEGFLV